MFRALLAIRPPAVLLALGLVVAVSGCGDQTDPVTTPAAGPETSVPSEDPAGSYTRWGWDEVVVDAVFIGTTAGEFVVNASSDPDEWRPATRWWVEVEEVLWVSPPRMSTAGEFRAPRSAVAPGDTLQVGSARGPLRNGARYVIAANAVREPEDEYLWPVQAAFDAATMQQEVAGTTPPLASLLLPGEGGVEDLRRALVEVLDQAVTWNNATRSGNEVPPGPRLALAQQLNAPRQPTTREELDAAEAERILARPAEQRQISSAPAAVMEALDLVEFSAIVLHDEAMNRNRGIGIITDAGYIGPYILGPGPLMMLIDDPRPRTGEMQVIVWETRSDVANHNYKPVEGGPVFAVAELETSTVRDPVLVFDLTANPPTATVLPFDEAAKIIESLAFP